MKTQPQLSETHRDPADVSGCKGARRLEVTFDEGGCFLLDISILPPLCPRPLQRIMPGPSWQLARHSATLVQAPKGSDRFLSGPGEPPPPPLS